ncbi:hypothetical protein GCM10022252_76150 [Streptosporangium oxazolinicum]|uniref:Uncharacterized protein n=1 Tax=Streptosporangium oxazolinicum TaxID=909287 RepID=A0ABP8BL09_9ACTN
MPRPSSPRPIQWRWWCRITGCPVAGRRFAAPSRAAALADFAGHYRDGHTAPATAAS